MNQVPEHRAIGSALVTGAGGFIGSHLVQRLLAMNVRVRALVRSPRHVSVLAESGAEVCVADLSEPESLKAAVQGADTVFHCAALSQAAGVTSQALETANVHGSQNLLDACLQSPSLKRLVHLSTVSVIGHVRPGEVVCESTSPHPSGPYGRSKLAAEHCVLQAKAMGLPVIIARPMWVYGERSPGTLKLFDLIARRRMVLIGGGRNQIQPIAIEDLVDALVLCAEVNGVEGEVMQFAGPTAMSTAQFCRDIASAIGVPGPRLDVPVPLAKLVAIVCEQIFPVLGRKPPMDSHKLAFFTTEHAYSNAKALKLLGWRPQTDFPSGVARVAAALRRSGVTS